MNLLAEGTNIQDIAQYEVNFDEFDKGELRVYLNHDLTEQDVLTIQTLIENEGVHLTEPISQDARILVIRFEKRIAPLLIIVGALGTIGTAIAAWQLTTLVKAMPWYVWVGGVGVVGLIAYKLLR